MKASDSFPPDLFDIALDVVGPLIDHRRWHVKWRVFYLARVGVARGQEWIPMPVRELAAITGRTDYWIGKVLKSMVLDHRVLLRDPPYVQKTGSRPAAFQLNPAIADWRHVPWDLPREHVLARLGYRRERDNWVLPRSFVRGVDEVSAAFQLARHDTRQPPRSRRRKTAAQHLTAAAVLGRGITDDDIALLDRGTADETRAGTPSYGSSKELPPKDGGQLRDKTANSDRETEGEIKAAVIRATGSRVFGRPLQRLIAVAESEGLDETLARIADVGRPGMHPLELSDWVAVATSPHEDPATHLEQRLQSLRRAIANRELWIERRVADGYVVDDEAQELEELRAESRQLEAELGLETGPRTIVAGGPGCDNGATNGAEVHA